MTEIRVPAPERSDCQAVQVDGKNYPVKDGYARISGRHADEIKAAGDWLAASVCSLSRTNLDESYCPNCKKKYLSLFGNQCFCGETRVPFDSKVHILKYA